MSQIECKNLELGYDSRVILSGLSFCVESGDYLCIVGENGSGKSTLMKTLLGIHKIKKGEIIFGDGIKKSEIGWLGQQTEVQKDFPCSVKEIVLSGCVSHLGIKPFFTKKEKNLAKKNMEKLGILDLQNRCYRELSGGQQQRVLLARALCATQKMLLLDEPVSNLDPIVTEEMYSIIKSLNDEGITIIMILHDIEAAKNYATKILHLGKRNFFGTKQEYIAAGSSFLRQKNSPFKETGIYFGRQGEFL